MLREEKSSFVEKLVFNFGKKLLVYLFSRVWILSLGRNCQFQKFHKLFYYLRRSVKKWKKKNLAKFKVLKEISESHGERF